MTLTWVLIAAAALCWPSPRRRHVSGVAGPRMSGSMLRLVVAVSAGAISVAACGLPWGAVGAAVAAPVSAAAVAALQSRPARIVPDRRSAQVLDLIAAALRAGQPTGAAVAMAAPAARPDVCAALQQVAGLLRLGAEPHTAWQPLADRDDLRAVAIGAGRSAHSGARLATTLEQLADDLRSQVRAAAEARAQKAGVLAIAPLGLCFLPAFACLGVIPVVIGVARGVVGAVP